MAMSAQIHLDQILGAELRLDQSAWGYEQPIRFHLHRDVAFGAGDQAHLPQRAATTNDLPRNLLSRHAR